MLLLLVQLFVSMFENQIAKQKPTFTEFGLLLWVVFLFVYFPLDYHQDIHFQYLNCRYINEVLKILTTSMCGDLTPHYAVHLTAHIPAPTPPSHNEYFFKLSAAVPHTVYTRLTGPELQMAASARLLGAAAKPVISGSELRRLTLYSMAL